MLRLPKLFFRPWISRAAERMAGATQPSLSAEREFQRAPPSLRSPISDWYLRPAPTSCGVALVLAWRWWKEA